MLEKIRGASPLDYDLCAILIGFTQRDNCPIAIVNIINLKFQAALVSEFIAQPSTLLPRRHRR